ncbi:dipeptide ABC transporter ATP-binding protein [Leucobacter sp. HY1910]
MRNELPSPADAPTLEVEHLFVDIPAPNGRKIRIIDDLSLTVYPGTCLGIVGESGSGKSVTLLSLFGLLLGANAEITVSRFKFAGQDIDPSDREAIRGLLRNEVAVIFQDPMTSLNPVMRVDKQIAEVVRQQRDVPAREIETRVVELLGMVGIPDAERRARQYPHEFSGGQRQRIMIAMAVAKEPKLIIADEPTTALDVTTQAQVLDLLRGAQKLVGAATIFVSHDLGVVAHLADTVAVFYGGRLMEYGETSTIFTEPRHPYTAALLQSIPPLTITLPRLLTLPGEPPDPRARPSGCVFHPRCPVGQDRAICAETPPPLTSLVGGRVSACHFPEETVTVGALRLTGPRVSVPRETETLTSPLQIDAAGLVAKDGPVLEVRELVKDYRPRRVRRRHGEAPAVDGISFELAAGSTVALVGESGCGKSTTAKMVGQLIEPTSGSVWFESVAYTSMNTKQRLDFRRRVQFVFQDPYASMNPRMTVGQIMAEPLETHHLGTRHDRESRVYELLERVGLRRRDAEKFPHQFSGGQRQRIAIARALAPRPEMLILDEPVSALDVSVQAQILNLLKDIQEEMKMTSLFISHDMSVVRQISEETIVMLAGKIVERGPTEQIISDPQHPYTRSLLGAVLTVDSMPVSTLG